MPTTVSTLPARWRALADAAPTSHGCAPSHGCAATLRACADELEAALARADPSVAAVTVARAEQDVDAGLAGTTTATREAIRAEGIALLADLYARFEAYGFTPDEIPVGTVTPYALVDIALDALGTAHYRATRRTEIDARATAELR